MALESWPIFLQHLDIDEMIPQKKEGESILSHGIVFMEFLKKIKKSSFFGLF